MKRGMNVQGEVVRSLKLTSINCQLQSCQVFCVHLSLTEFTAVEKLVMGQGFDSNISVYLHQICKQYKI